MNIGQYILTNIFPKYTWIRKTSELKVYLTFDDGPIPQVTEWVLDLLQHYNIKATFFCIGDNIRKHPSVFKRIINEGHQVGNHTFNHLNGWKTSEEDYIANALLCEKEIKKYCSNDSKLFRPPYGKIKTAQAKRLSDKGYEIIMWHNLTKDYDRNLTPKQCLRRSLKHLKKGSIIVFHDSLKAQENMKYALPILIESLLDKGYTFDTL
ncbi:polysaccharide deacetylase family protein [Myroides sp. LoEW2-1]|uniref:polysaccharide deacetylase family protein n=1 Tax=Myroides sp. LoEW2-1 TaxID=2683192 RepID=UPI001326466D|nr:polysaccharide deacetylase family protein [Myroides sp. LoEW2-1]MVX34456.1 polysaccharide deacetylase family protein [Myroides sp. LoEW2-1]